MKILYRILLVLMAFMITQASVAQRINKKLAAELADIFKADQKYRTVAAKSPEEDRQNSLKQSPLDAANYKRIEQIIAKYGYPGKSLVGDRYKKVAFFVIQHAEPEARDKYLPLLTKAAKKGELPASSVAIMLDRSRTDKGQLQVYGSQTHETADGVKIYPIEDEPNVNNRRAKVGLEPLEEYLKQWNIHYTLPTADKPNPADMYYHAEQREESRVEAIGGDQAILNQLTYPEKARENNIRGTVMVEFTIDPAGLTKDITIVSGLGYGCDEEAIRVIKAAKYSNPSGADHGIRMRLPFPYKK